MAKLFKWFDSKDISSYIHEVSKEELLIYGNEDIEKILLKKLNAYNILSEKNYEEDKYFNNIISQYSQNENSQVDNMLLRKIYDYNIEIFLTDDKLMLKKAEDLYIRDRV